MNIVDSSGWLSYFADDGNAELFSQPIEATEALLVPSITLTEVFKNVLRQRGEEPALEAIAHMEQGTVTNLDNKLAINAAFFGVEYKLPLADSIIYATTRKYDALLWTQNADFQGLEQVRYFPRQEPS